MARRRRRSDLDEPLPQTNSQTPLPSASRRFVRRCFWLLAFAAVLVAFAPQIIGRTALLGQLVAWGTADLRGTVSIGEASLSWFSAPQLSNVALIDESGRPVLTAAGLRGDRTLWQLVGTPTQLGRIQLDRPQFDLVVDEHGATNWEQVLSRLLAASPATKAAIGVDFAVEIIDGVVRIHDRPTQRVWTIDRLTGVVVVPASAAAPLTGDVQGNIVTADGPRRFALQTSVRDASTAGDGYRPQGDAAANVEALPLELIELALRRAAPGLKLTGLAQGEVRGRFDLAAARPTGDLAGQFTVVQLAVGGEALAGDELRQSRVDCTARAQIDGERLQLDDLTVICELARLDARGSLDHYNRLFDGTGPADLTDLLWECEGRAAAKLDLARIAQSLPQLLRVRDDVQLTGGSVRLEASSQGEAGRRRRQLEIHTDGVTAVHNGSVIAWPEPLIGIASLNDTAAGPTLERVQCRSDFLTIDGAQTADGFEFRGEYDLARLGERLSQFIDLGGVQFAGRGTAQGTWLREQGDRFHVNAQADVNEFALTVPGTPTWREQRLILGLDGLGRADGFSVFALEQASAGVQSGGDELTFRLVEPVADVRAAAATLPIEVVGRGDLGTWLARIRPFAGLSPTLTAGGGAALNATLRWRIPDDVEIVQSKLQATPFRFAGYGLTFDEQVADLQLAGRYRTNETTVTNAIFTTPQLQLQLQQGLHRVGDDGRSEIGGNASYRADVAKLLTLFGKTNLGGTQCSGMLEGGARLQLADRRTTAAVDATVKNFSVAQPGGAAWQEPAVRIIGTGVYDPARDSLDFDRLELAADALRVQLSGRVAQLTSACFVDGRGEVTYDLARLTPLAQTLLGSGVQLAGREAQPFELTGPLLDPNRTGLIAWEKLNGATRVGWQAANLYGFQLGPAALDAKLNQGLLRVQPVEVPINTGRVRLAPSLRLGPGPMELQHDAGTLVDHVSITPEMANERLKYVMPIVAGIASASGQFSVALDEFRFPLDNPNAATAGGRVTVHAVDIGPGALTQEMATLLQQPLTISLKRESTVDFKLIQGRVYHQNLEFAFPGATIRTYGSVGLDQTISLVAEMPLPTAGLGNRPILGAAMSAQTIRVPIGGTLQRPQLDRNAFAQAAAQSLQQGAQGAIEAGLNRGLQKLLGPGAAAPQPGTSTK